MLPWCRFKPFIFVYLFVYVPLEVIIRSDPQKANRENMDEKLGWDNWYG